MKYYIGILFLMFFLYVPVFISAQMLETKYELSFSAGMGTINGSESNIFFPEFVTQEIENYNLVCTRNVLPWMDAGFSAGYMKLNSIDLREGIIKSMTLYRGNIKGIGPLLAFHLPYVRSGIWNRLVPRLVVSSRLQFLENSRVLKFDNIIVHENSVGLSPTIMMPNADSGLGLSFNPGIKYRASQILGVYLGLGYSYSFFSTKYGDEQLNPVFFEVGLSVNFGNYDTLFL